nr:ATP-binding cassette domain-containing protein [Blautia sp. TF12-12AT]
MILELENICKEYMQGKIPVPVLKNIDFSMEEGEYVAIMGPSGSGKTTLMNIVGCLDQATSGRLILDGQDISKCSDNQMSDIRLQKIGFVFQNFQLLGRQSAMENVCLPLTYAGVPKKERRERAAIASSGWARRPYEFQTDPALRRTETACGDCKSDRQPSENSAG